MTPNPLPQISVTITQVLKEYYGRTGQEMIVEMLNRLPEVSAQKLEDALFIVATKNKVAYIDLNGAVEQLSNNLHMYPDVVQKGLKWLNLAATVYQIVAGIFGWPVPKIVDVIPVVQAAYDKMKGE